MHLTYTNPLYPLGSIILEHPWLSTVLDNVECNTIHVHVYTGIKVLQVILIYMYICFPVEHIQIPFFVVILKSFSIIPLYYI